MTRPTLLIRPAVAADLAPLHLVIERAYRGDAARSGWTHEADLIEGQRTDLANLEAILAHPDERLLVAGEGGALVGCVQLSRRAGGLAYLALLTVDPLLQAAGLGRRLLEAAEATARSELDAATMELSVVDGRAELIAYYERRGYAKTGERRPFPVEMTPPLTLVVMTKALPPSA